MPILDQFGRPIPATPTRTALDIAGSVGISHPAQHYASIATALSPARAAQHLRDAKAGNADAYLALAEELEERDLHWASLIQTRKLAVVGEPPEILPGDDTPAAQEVADAFRETVAEEDYFVDALFDMMDAISKGYSVIQPVWDTSGPLWTFSELRWEDPRLFQFDRDRLRELRMRDSASSEGRELPPGFVVHYPKIKTGVRIRGGLAMLGTVAYVSKSYTLADWLAFCEVYGMPMRIAYVDPETMTQPELDAIKIALANIGHDAAAIVPTGAKIDISDARRPTSGQNVFEPLANFWDAQSSKAVLGQTMTTDDGSSKSQAEVHDKVRLDIKRADARSLAATVREGLVKPWVRYNFGDSVALPKLKFPVEPSEDLKEFTEAALPWVERGGLRVKASEIRERFGFSAPDGEDEDEIIGLPPARATGEPVQRSGGTAPAAAGSQGSAPSAPNAPPA